MESKAKIGKLPSIKISSHYVTSQEYENRAAELQQTPDQQRIEQLRKSVQDAEVQKANKQQSPMW